MSKSTSRCFLFLFFFSTTFLAFSQKDSNYIYSFYDKLIVKPYFGGPSFTMAFEPRNAPDSAISSFEPNTYGIIGIDLGYKSVGLSLSKRAGDLLDQSIYGKSKYRSLSARFTWTNFSFEFYFKDYKGYADLYTPRYIKPLPGSSPFIIRNDLRNKYYKLKTIYQFSRKKFSYSAAFSYTEKQKKSAATWLLLGNINRLNMSADSSFFPSVLKSYYGNLSSMNDLRVGSIGIAPGGGFSLVHKKFFFSVIVFLGTEIQFQHYYLPEFKKWENSVRMALLADSRISMGFNGNRAFIGITGKNDANYLNLRTFNASTIFSMATIDFGYRFNAPKSLEKEYSKAEAFINSIF